MAGSGTAEALGGGGPRGPGAVGGARLQREHPLAPTHREHRSGALGGPPVGARGTRPEPGDGASCPSGACGPSGRGQDTNTWARLTLTRRGHWFLARPPQRGMRQPRPWGTTPPGPARSSESPLPAHSAGPIVVQPLGREAGGSGWRVSRAGPRPARVCGPLQSPCTHTPPPTEGRPSASSHRGTGPPPTHGPGRTGRLLPAPHISHGRRAGACEYHSGGVPERPPQGPRTPTQGWQRLESGEQPQTTSSVPGLAQGHRGAPRSPPQLSAPTGNPEAGNRGEWAGG